MKLYGVRHLSQYWFRFTIQHNPLLEPMLIYCQLDSYEKTSVKLETKYTDFFQQNAFENVYKLSAISSQLISWQHGGTWYRADSRFVPSQWETLLQSNAVSHRLGANISIALQRAAVSPLLMYWKYHTLTLSHWYDFSRSFSWPTRTFLSLMSRCTRPWLWRNRMPSTTSMATCSLQPQKTTTINTIQLH